MAEGECIIVYEKVEKKTMMKGVREERGGCG